MGPDMIISLAYVVADVSLLLCCLPMVGSDVWALRGKAWLAVLYGGVLCSAFAFQLLTWANQYVDASIGACYCVLNPIATGVLAFFVLQEPLTWRDGCGCVLAILGLALLSSKNQQSIRNDGDCLVR